MRRVLPRVGLCLLFFFTATIGLTQSPTPPSQKMPSAETASPGASDYVGSEICATCHDEAAKKFASNPHARLSREHDGKGISCEGCHGPGKAHVDCGGDVTKIRQLGKLSAREVNESCLKCHAGEHANFERSRHAEAEVSCLSCHSVHHSKSKASPFPASNLSQNKGFAKR
jgi:Cytochrome c554 and c-prime